MFAHSCSPLLHPNGLETKLLSKNVFAHSCSSLLSPSLFGDRSADQECVRTFLLPICVPKMFGDERAEQDCVFASYSWGAEWVDICMQPLENRKNFTFTKKCNRKGNPNWRPKCYIVRGNAGVSFQRSIHDQ